MIKMKYSIIIPAYNCENSIINTISSVVSNNYNYNDYEIIIINDGSNDNTQECIKKYIDKNIKVNIKLFNKKNSGVSSSRNYGLTKANGEFILFLDADDTVQKDYFKVIDSYINDSDILLFSFKVIGDSNRPNDTNVINFYKNNNFSKEDLLRALLCQKNNILGYVWRVCIKKDIIINNKILFHEGIKLSEDYLFMFECLKKAEKVSITECEIYNYIINSKSVTSKYIESMKNDLLYVNNVIMQSLKNNMINTFKPSIANSYLLILQNFCKNKNYKKSDINNQIFQLRKNKILNDSINYSILHFREITIKKYISFLFIFFKMEKVYIFLYRKKYKKKLNDEVE